MAPICRKADAFAEPGYAFSSTCFQMGGKAMLNSTFRGHCWRCRRLTNLESLELCGGALTDQGVDLLSTLTNLQSLSLAQNTRISDLSLLALSRLSALTALNLTQSRVTGNGILTLQVLTVRSLIPVLQIGILTCQTNSISLRFGCRTLNL